MDFTQRQADAATAELCSILVPLLDEAIALDAQAEYEAGRGSGVGDVAYNRIGAGYIAVECERELAFRYHRAVKEVREGCVTQGELIRHAEAGHWTEEMTCDWLTLAGFTIEIAKDDGSGKQIGWMAAKDAAGQHHMAGEVDGLIVGVEHPRLAELLAPPTIWESKKATAKKWSKFNKEGVKKADPVYYGQLQTNMGYLGVKNTLFSMLNLDTMKYHFEIIPFDLQKAQFLSDRAVRVIGSKSPYEFPRLGRTEDDFVCKFCDYHNQCWKMSTPLPFDPNKMDEVPF